MGEREMSRRSTPTDSADNDPSSSAQGRDRGLARMEGGLALLKHVSLALMLSNQPYELKRKCQSISSRHPAYTHVQTHYT